MIKQPSPGFSRHAKTPRLDSMIEKVRNRILPVDGEEQDA